MSEPIEMGGGEQAETPRSVLTHKVTSVGPQVPCTTCGRGMGLSFGVLGRYLQSENDECPTCNAKVDWFEALKQSASFATLGFSAIGATLSVIEVHLTPNGVVDVDFDKLIGAGKRLLWVQYLPIGNHDGAVWPIEIHGNDPFRAPRPQIRLFGHVHGNPPPEHQKCTIAVSWVEHSPDDSSWTSLVDAFEFFYESDYPGIVVPANVAVEVRLGRMLTELLMKKASLGRERTEQFLQDGATYGYQIDVLVPLIVALTGGLALRQRVAAGLKQLRKLRNDIAHRGEPSKAISQESASELLVASLFAVVYVEMLRQKLLS